MLVKVKKIIKNYYGEGADLILENEDAIHYNNLMKLTKSEIAGRVVAYRRRAFLQRHKENEIQSQINRSQ